MAVMHSKKTKLYFLYKGEFMAVKRLTELKGIHGGEAANIDVTDLDATEYKQYIAGLKESPSVSMTIHLDDEDASHTALLDLSNKKTNTLWVVVFPNQASVDTDTQEAEADYMPSITADAKAKVLAGSSIEDLIKEDPTIFTGPAHRSYCRIQGYISSFPIDVAIDSPVDVAMTVQTSGEQALVFKPQTTTGA